MQKVLYLMSIIALILVISSCKDVRRFEEAFFAMDTRVEIIAYSPNEKTFRKAMDEITAECKRMEVLFSNSRKGSMAVTDKETMSLIKTSLEYSEETENLFDITIAPVKWLWGLGTGQTLTVPDSSLLAKTLSHVGWRKIRISCDSVYFDDPYMRIDLGGIAKGYSLTKLNDIMINNGINSFLINAGGDIVLGDAKPDGTLWVVGIRHPRDGGEPIRKLHLKNISVVTSGDYERFFIASGKRYHHIFNPATGMSSQGIISATVIAADPIRADVYSTTMMIRGNMNPKSLPKDVLKIIMVDDSLRITEFEKNE
jgi:thiamine biosynthesis lipoprotein